ncbi:MAG: hypothetical protein NTY70_17405 [Burkholderiales bacterium]|nr:hypothetical protein [Burkholderiales bacterium]
MKTKHWILVVLAALSLLGAAYAIWLPKSAKALASPVLSVEPASANSVAGVPKEFDELLLAYRKIIVLFADEKKLSAKELENIFLRKNRDQYLWERRISQCSLK